MLTSIACSFFLLSIPCRDKNLSALTARSSSLSCPSCSNVSIHNLHTVAPCYRELLALLVHLTWLLHVGQGFETCLVPLSFSKIYNSTLYKVLYVHSYSPTRACTGELLVVVAWQGLGCPYFHPICMISSLYAHVCRGVLAFIICIL